MERFDVDAPSGATLEPCPDEVLGELRPVLAALGRTGARVQRYHDARLRKNYEVYRLEDPSGAAVLKHAHGPELRVHRELLAGHELPVTELLASCEVDGVGWMLLAEVPGHDLQACTRRQAAAVGRALAAVQRVHWHPDPRGVPSGDVDGQLGKVEHLRGLVGEWPELVAAMEQLAGRQRHCPWVLSQGDFLGVNVIAGDERVTIIDWANGAIRPWCADAGRFLCFTAPSGGVYQLDEGGAEALVEQWHAGLGGVEHLPPLEVLWRDLAGEVCFQHCAALGWSVQQELAGDDGQRDEWFERSLADAHDAAARFRRSD